RENIEKQGGRRAAIVHDSARSPGGGAGMKARIAELIAALRRAEIPVSVAEAMDAAQAAALAGVARPVLRDALAATLVKDERDRSVFLVAFDAVFPARARDVARAPGRRKARSASISGDDGGAASSGAAEAGSAAAS